MNKFFIASIILLGCCATQAAHQKQLTIEKYIGKANKMWGADRKWLAQLQSLKTSEQLSDKMLYLGVPIDQQVKPTYGIRFLNYLFGKSTKTT